MSLLTVDGKLLRKMIIAGSNELTRNKKMVDSLNVFPVPDGDTGTNMSLTLLTAAKEVEKLHSSSVSEIAKAAASGSLRGARGNSGVILSQLFRGFSKGLEGKTVASTDDLANAFIKASEAAYKAMMKPKEGTILTVARSIAERFEEFSYDIEDIEKVSSMVIKYANDILAKTTQMLPELRQAGVVDAGGKGLILILEGAYACINSPGEVTVDETLGDKNADEPEHALSAAAVSSAEIEFTYCTEFFINIENETDNMENEFKEYLQNAGDSVVAVFDEDIVKVHIHTNHPGKVLERALLIGSLDNLKVDNMKLQHNSLISFSPENNPPKDTGFVAVSIGQGLKKLFKSIGVDEVIEGGQTMNPSTEDIMEAIGRVNANNVFVLPNNKNITMAAQQAAEMTTGKKVRVLPSKSIPQGLTAVINYIADNDANDNFEVMSEAMTGVTTGQVTYAVKSTCYNDKEIKEGSILCMLNGDIVHVDVSLQEGAKKLADKLLENGGEVFSIYYGQDVTLDMAEELRDYISENHSGCEIEVLDGTQPLYYYIMSVE